MLQIRWLRTGTRRSSGKFDLLIIAIIFLLIFGAFIFVLFQIIGHSEDHVEKVRKTKVIYNESLRWRPEGQMCEASIRNDLANSPGRKSVEYTNLNLDERCLKLIGKMSRLQDLKLTRSTLQDQWLEHLTKLPLRSLGLNSTAITDKAIPLVLSSHPNLECLGIGDTEVTDKGLEGLSTSKTLTRLELNLARNVTDNGIKHVGKMTQLMDLELGESRHLTGKCLSYLKNLKGLRFLNIESMSLTNGDIHGLSSFEHLLNLDVSNCQLKDDDLVEIVKCGSLSTLNLTGNNLTDKGLMSLKKLKNLQLLTMRDSPGLHKQSVEKFRLAMPNCRVEYSPSSKLNERMSRKNVKEELQFLKDEAEIELKKKHNLLP